MLRYAWQDLRNTDDGIRRSELLTMDFFRTANHHAHHSAGTCGSRMHADCQIIVPIGEHSVHYVQAIVCSTMVLAQVVPFVSSYD